MLGALFTNATIKERRKCKLRDGWLLMESQRQRLTLGSVIDGSSTVIQIDSGGSVDKRLCSRARRHT